MFHSIMNNNTGYFRYINQLSHYLSTDNLFLAKMCHQVNVWQVCTIRFKTSAYLCQLFVHFPYTGVFLLLYRCDSNFRNIPPFLQSIFVTVSLPSPSLSTINSHLDFFQCTLRPVGSGVLWRLLNSFRVSSVCQLPSPCVVAAALADGRLFYASLNFYIFCNLCVTFHGKF